MWTVPSGASERTASIGLPSVAGSPKNTVKRVSFGRPFRSKHFPRIRWCERTQGAVGRTQHRDAERQIGPDAESVEAVHLHPDHAQLDVVVIAGVHADAGLRADLVDLEGVPAVPDAADADPVLAG